MEGKNKVPKLHTNVLKMAQDLDANGLDYLAESIHLEGQARRAHAEGQPTSKPGSQNTAPRS